ncbi:hypothetical protein mRhiFer1_009523 [Rhinolophus ferrumequinum]|uniref:Uncharacterized protein n=1 Tax=Rhinolophus ferrumequinum TaxID=59479 RepID=A0A7J7RAV9_RHIFE|nr:hypothetical protein mRhiFer1_009523 [Rhinolophus ferrumequinum]
MQMRPLGPPTLHCCVETRRTPDAAKTRLRSWAWGGRRVPRAEPHAPRSGCAQDERHPAFHWPWVVGEDHLSKLLALVRHLLLRAGDIASLWRIWVLTEDAQSQAASDWLRLDDLPRLWMCQIHTRGRSFGCQAAKQRT